MADTPPWLWGLFATVLVALLAFDLGVVGRQKAAIGTRQALLLTGGYVAVALLFGGAVFLWDGPGKGFEYLTGYVLEESLSLDNMLVFSLILGHFQVPRTHQHRVLFWGVLGALVMRALMIVAGSALLERLEWVIYVFGAIVIVSGIRILRQGGEAPDLEDNRILKLVRRHMRITKNYDGRRFFVRRDGVRYATPLLATLVLIEASDLIFALDSIPAIFGVTRDPFIVYTSNAFAILGLRALYFALAGLIRRFAYLHYGLALVLVLIGVKMIVGELIEIPIWVMLAATLLIIMGSAILSLVMDRRQAASAAARP